MAITNNLPLSNQKGLGELWSRLRFLFLAILVYRFGTHIPIPGLDPERIANLFNKNQGTILGMFNMFSGGALARMSILALGIMPYISSSIIMQLLSSVTPSLEQLKKEGDSGRRKINQYTRYFTVVLATVQAFAMAASFHTYAYGGEAGFAYYFTSVTSLVTGAVFMMWLGEQVTERGIGNGISMLIFAGIVAGMPSAIVHAIEGARQGDVHYLALVVVGAVALGVVWLVILIERGQRRITVNYAKRQPGRQGYGAQSSHLPLKINMAGVIPAIFASSILLFPASIAQWFGQGGEGKINEFLQDFAAAIGPGQPLNILLFTGLITFFCFFYTALMFNPKEVADNLKKSGAYIPGIRPGEHSAKYIDSVLTRLTVMGAIYMSLVCLLPQFLQVAANVPFYLGGTSLLIVVVVVMDFMSQVQAHLMSHQYESLMKKSNLKGYGSGNAR
jgi:preprotein translocase subunit SecY